MNYEEMSSAEINDLVSKRDTSDTECHEGKVFKLHNYNLEKVISVGGVVDYCNNPSDYMPIAIENEINIIFHYDGVEVCADHPLNESKIYHECPKNQIGRAICIVFLKMMEAKHEK